jgi:hypothetical protein
MARAETVCPVLAFCEESKEFKLTGTMVPRLSSELASHGRCSHAGLHFASWMRHDAHHPLYELQLAAVVHFVSLTENIISKRLFDFGVISASISLSARKLSVSSSSQPAHLSPEL